MPSNTNPAKNERTSSTANGEVRQTLWGGLFNDKGGILLLGAGLILILWNIAVFLGIDTRPNDLLYYLNMRYWSIYFSIALWTAVIWLILEMTESVEDYLPFIRVSMAICIVLTVCFALRSYLGTVYPTLKDSPLWFDIVIGIAVCCIVRSAFLLYIYRYDGSDAIDLEEAQWFWGMSGFIFTGMIIFVIMYMIPVKMPVHAAVDNISVEPLLMSCYHGLQNLIQTGQGSLVLRLFALSTFIVSIAFVFVAGKWMLIFLSRMRGE